MGWQQGVKLKEKTRRGRKQTYRVQEKQYWKRGMGRKWEPERRQEEWEDRRVEASPEIDSEQQNEVESGRRISWRTRKDNIREEEKGEKMGRGTVTGIVEDGVETRPVNKEKQNADESGQMTR